MATPPMGGQEALKIGAYGGGDPVRTSTARHVIERYRCYRRPCRGANHRRPRVLSEFSQNVRIASDLDALLVVAHASMASSNFSGNRMVTDFSPATVTGRPMCPCRATLGQRVRFIPCGGGQACVSWRASGVRNVP